MEAQRFDHLARHLSRGTARRRLLAGVALSPFAGLVARSADDIAAKKKHKKKRKPKKPKPNAYGCLNAGQACGGDSALCCSGICEGKKCRAHDTGTCKQEGPELCVIDPPLALTCNDDATCRCFGTTAGSIVCARYAAEGCADCGRDADCRALGYPPEAVCVPMSTGPCAGACTGSTACLIPCALELSSGSTD